MQVHHGFDVEDIAGHAVNDGVRKPMKVELAILTS
jgi:hypothetical protein